MTASCTHSWRQTPVVSVGLGRVRDTSVCVPYSYHLGYLLPSLLNTFNCSLQFLISASLTGVVAPFLCMSQIVGYSNLGILVKFESLYYWFQFISLFVCFPVLVPPRHRRYYEEINEQRGRERQRQKKFHICETFLQQLLAHHIRHPVETRQVDRFGGKRRRGRPSNADDIALLSDTRSSLQDMTTRLHEQTTKLGLHMSCEKT